MFDGRDVEVPVLALHGDAVEVGDLTLAAEALLELLQLDGHVVDRRVDLAGDEVALAVGAEDLGERLAGA